MIEDFVLRFIAVLGVFIFLGVTAAGFMVIPLAGLWSIPIIAIWVAACLAAFFTFVEFMDEFL